MQEPGYKISVCSPARAASSGAENLAQGLQVPSALGKKSAKHFGNALVAGETSQTDTISIGQAFCFPLYLPVN